MADTSDESPVLSSLAQNPPSPDERILRALEKELASPPEEQPWYARFYPWQLPSRQARVFASLSLTALVLGLGSLRAMNVSGIPALLTALAGGLGLCALFVPSAVPGPARASRTSRQVLVLVVALLAVGYVSLTIADFDPLSSVLRGYALAQVMSCGLHVLLTGTLCLLALLAPWQRSDPFSPTLLGGLLGALAGYAGMLLVDAACASTEGFHILIGHASAVLVFGLGGAIVGRRWLSP